MPYITTRFVFCSVPQQQGGVLMCSPHRDTSVGPIPADCSLASRADECVTFSNWRVLCQRSICCLKSLMCQLVFRPRLRDLTEDGAADQFARTKSGTRWGRTHPHRFSPHLQWRAMACSPTRCSKTSRAASPPAAKSRLLLCLEGLAKVKTSSTKYLSG